MQIPCDGASRAAQRNAMAVRGLGHLDERKAQELSNTAWALTTAHSEQARDSDGPCHPSILVWALPKPSQTEGFHGRKIHLSQTLCGLEVHRVSSRPPQRYYRFSTVSSLVFAKAAVEEPPIDAASSMALDRLGEFSPRHSANLAWCPGAGFSLRAGGRILHCP